MKENIEREKARESPRVVIVEYLRNDFNQAIDEAREDYGEQVAVIAVPSGCKLIKRRPSGRRKEKKNEETSRRLLGSLPQL